VLVSHGGIGGMTTESNSIAGVTGSIKTTTTANSGIALLSLLSQLQHPTAIPLGSDPGWGIDEIWNPWYGKCSCWDPRRGSFGRSGILIICLI